MIDKLADGIGTPLKNEDISIVLFGDSPIEEETRPDSDMIEDEIQISRALGNSKRVIEAFPIEDFSADFRKVPFLETVNEDYALEYFIDGSIRTKYLGEIITANGTGGALMIASLGAISVKIDRNKWKVVPHNSLTRLIVYMTGGLPDTTKTNIKAKLNSLSQAVNVEFIELGEAESNIRSSAGGKARSEMHKTEIDVAKSIGSDRKWIAVDGALRKKEFIDLERAIGIAKSFGGKVIFVGRGKSKTISHLARMKVGERTKVYRYRSLSNDVDTDERDTLEKIAFWYLRIRQPPPEMMPLGGIVKVDIAYKSDDAYEDLTGTADELSGSILRLSDPSIFPRPRWPSFAYPVRVAEECLEPLLYSKEEFMRLGISLKRVMYNG